MESKAPAAASASGTCQVILWIDAETLLPLKRLVAFEGNQGKPGRITETNSEFTIDAKVDAKLFELPK